MRGFFFNKCSIACLLTRSRMQVLRRAISSGLSEEDLNSLDPRKDNAVAFIDAVLSVRLLYQTSYLTR